MDLSALITELLKQTNPGSLLWVAGAAALTKGTVDAVKGLFPGLKGNLIQTITAGVALVATAIQAGATGVFAGGLTAVEVGSILGVAALTWLGALGIHTALWDHTKKPLVVASADEAQAAIDAIKAKTS